MLKEVVTKPEVSFFVSLMIPLIAVGISFGIATARLDNIDRRLVTAETKIENQIELIQEVNIGLTGIQKDIQYIKAALDIHIN